MTAKTYRKLQVVQLSTDFRQATRVTEVPLTPPAAGQVLVKVHYSGINATDINASAGVYFPKGTTLPSDIGFEALGVVESVGDGVTSYSKGQPVLVLDPKGITCYSEYVYAQPETLFPVPDVKPEHLVYLINGLTAAIGLDEAGRIQSGDKVLVTAAAGGTGQVAVQWAKLKGCHVIGTTSSDEKAAFLKSIGVDTVINYRTEDLSESLKRQFPSGVDVIWETIGGKTLETLLNHLSIKGRLVVIGGITGYKEIGLPPLHYQTYRQSY